jgi:hypothetical protein
LASPDPHVTYVLFDAKCLTSKDARKSATAHDGRSHRPTARRCFAQVLSQHLRRMPAMVWPADDLAAGDASSEMGLGQLMYALRTS